MIKLSFAFALSLGWTFIVHAQSKTIQFETDAEVVWAGVDRPGDLFLVLVTGEVQKFNKEGKKIGSHGFATPPTLLDPLDGVQSFYYLRNENQYGNLSSDLVDRSQRRLDPSFAIRPWLVCPSLHELWILDSADFSIKKTKLNSAGISLESTLKHLPDKRIIDYTYLREYQNYLFLLDTNSGVHLFNNLGKYVKTFGEKDLSYFNFLGEEIYFLRGKEIILIDLFSNEKRTLSLPLECRFALLTDDRLYAVGASSVTVFEFKP